MKYMMMKYHNTNTIFKKTSGICLLVFLVLLLSFLCVGCLNHLPHQNKGNRTGDGANPSISSEPKPIVTGDLPDFTSPQKENPTMTSIPITPTTKPSGTFPDQATDPSANETIPGGDKILSTWEFKMRSNRYVTILQGTMKRETSETVLAEASLAETKDGQYKILITPHTINIDGKDLRSNELRNGRLEYEANLEGNQLSFLLESELFAHQDDYSDGYIKPLLCSLTIDTTKNPRIASERQIHQNISSTESNNREYSIQIYLDLKEIVE